MPLTLRLKISYHQDGSLVLQDYALINILCSKTNSAFLRPKIVHHQHIITKPVSQYMDKEPQLFQKTLTNI